MEQNKERYKWDNSDIDEHADTMEVNPDTLNKIPDDLPGIYMETDNSGTSVVAPELDQSDTERINEAKNNSVLIPVGNNSRSTGVATLVDDTPLGGVDPIDVAQECVSPK